MFPSALGHSAEPKVPVPKAVVRDPQLRRERPPGVREEPLQARQGVPGQGRAGRQVQAHERRQGGCKNNYSISKYFLTIQLFLNDLNIFTFY